MNTNINKIDMYHPCILILYRTATVPKRYQERKDSLIRKQMFCNPSEIV